MNIWALDKHVAIKHLLLLLEQRFTEGSFEIGDLAELPATAIRLRSPDEPALSIYIYTHGQDEEHYGIHLEYPRLSETPVSDTVEMLENVSFERLVEFLAMHLNAVDLASA
jgi:hypothetical protein